MERERIIDMHIHSDNSPDGKHSPMFICEQAVAKNLRAIAITDHCEVDSYFSQKYNHMIFHSFFESSKARVAFEGQLLVLLGVELGQPCSNPELTKKIISSYPFDVVLGSIHKPKGYNCDVKQIPYNEIDIYDFMKNYFRELTDMADKADVDIISHITCPMRRIQGTYKMDFDYSRIKKEIDELLDIIIKREKALEINTSGLRHAMSRPMPEKDIIQRYRQLGGNYITIGSDSHSAYEVGSDIREGMKIARQCGFDKLTFYIERQRMEIKNNI